MTELDDDTLIALTKDGDTHAEALLCAKYWVFARNLGRRFASSYSDLGLTADDFAAVAFSSLAEAMKKYRSKKEKSFKGYWLTVAKNQCINFIHDNSFIDLEVSRPLSLDSETREDGLTLHEICGDIDHKIKDDINLMQLYEFIVSPNSRLSNNQKVVAYYMFIENYTFEDVQELTKWSYDKIYHVASRARMKVSNFFKSGYFKR